jgi:glyoxylase-like metal-dependent hydrolase (beta-lactamase superfamily II)
MRINFINIWGNYVSKCIPGELFYPQPTGKLMDNLYTVQDEEVNLFIVTDGENTICVDAGFRNNNYIKEEFDKIGIDLLSITHLFLTHTDMDHAGGVEESSNADWFKNATIYLGREEEKLITKKYYRRFFFYTPIRIKRKYELLDDGDEIVVGRIKVKTLLTPGHTQGHLSFLINSKTLCTGDLLLLKDGKVKPFYKVWNNDHNLDKESIKSIAKLEGVEAVCTAHSKSTFDFRKAFEEWI